MSGSSISSQMKFIESLGCQGDKSKDSIKLNDEKVDLPTVQNL